jgi:hypothetical protein
MPKDIKLSGGTPFWPSGGTDTTGVGIDVFTEPVVTVPVPVTVEAAEWPLPLLLPTAACDEDGDGVGDAGPLALVPLVPPAPRST